MNRRVLGGAGALFVGMLGAYFATVGAVGPGLAVGPCGITVTSPARARDGQVHLRSGQSLTLSLAGTATRCPNTTLTRTFDDGGTAAITVTDAGTWSSSTTVADAVTTTITVSSVDGGSTALVVDALTTRARLQVTAPSRDDWDVWFLVSSKVDAGCGNGGNLNAERFGRPGYVSDVGCADGGQLNPSVTVTGASGGWLSVTWNGVALVDAGIASSPATLTQAQLGTLTLPEFGVGELAFSVLQDDGGTEALTTYATVRTVSPPALLGADGGGPALSILNARDALVRVDYVLPHIPVEIGAAHTEFVWTTGSVPCTGGGGSAQGSCYSLADGDAGFFSVNNSTTSPAICAAVAVPDGGCAYSSMLIWVKVDGGYSRANTVEYPTGTSPEAGDRLGVAAVTRSSTCAGAVIAINPRMSCVSAVARPPANAYTMSDGGGSTRDYWDSFYTSTGVALSIGAYPVFDPAVPLFPSSAIQEGYLKDRSEVQDCRLYDSDSSPQAWKCVDGTTIYEGGVRSGQVNLPPINNYAIMPVLAW